MSYANQKVLEDTFEIMDFEQLQKAIDSIVRARKLSFMVWELLG